MTVEQLVPTAHVIARREVAKHGIDYDEVLSDAMWGLALATVRCDGRPLGPYARSTMEGEVMHGKRRRGGMRADSVSRQRPPRLVPLQDGGTIAAVDESADPVAVSDRRELWRRVDAALDARSRLVVRLRFEWELSQSEIAQLVGVSQMHVSRILRAALGRLQAVV